MSHYFEPEDKKLYKKSVVLLGLSSINSSQVKRLAHAETKMQNEFDEKVLVCVCLR